jgi:hypothetical protein
MTCDCTDKVILVERDGKIVADESFCKHHGYDTSCVLCNVKIWAKEDDLCIRHRLLNGYTVEEESQ